EDTGRNSVSPSTTPRTKALKRSNDMPGSAGGVRTSRRAPPNRERRSGGQAPAFPASLTLEQRGQANIAHLARPAPIARVEPHLTWFSLRSRVRPRSASELRFSSPRHNFGIVRDAAC